jgi:hypothetical protein
MTALKDKLYQTIPAKPITRRELALAAGRKNGKLTQYDLQLLTELESEGKIKIGKTTQGIVQEAYTYQRKENGK